MSAYHTLKGRGGALSATKGSEIRGKPMEKRRRRTKRELWVEIQRLVSQLLQEERVPTEERFDGLILAMRAHGLPCDPKRVEKIRKLWLECVAERKKRRKRT